ncbi:MAG: family ATPase [Sphingobacteriales bacterium]|nr:family ATPase [Sphingobacteriales bacterium]
MELANFFKLLSKQKFTLIIIPLITIIISFFLVRNLPNVYQSESPLSTGLVDQTQQILNSNETTQESQINQEFSNLIEMMHLKKVFNQVSYKLMIHDLTSDQPFRVPSKDVEDLNISARQHAIKIYNERYEKNEPLSLLIQDEKGLQNVIGSMRYDYSSLNNKVNIYRSQNSDFITVGFESEDPQLSAFVVNTLIDEFIKFYSQQVKTNQIKAKNFLNNLLKQKRSSLDEKLNGLKNYKIENRVLNLNEQAKSLYSQIADYEGKKEQTEKDVVAYIGAIQGINNKFKPRDRKYFESTLTHLNQDILRTKAKLRNLNDLYIQSNFEEEYPSRIDSLQNVLTSQINALTDKSIFNPLLAKESLIQQKLTLEISLDLAKYSIKSLNYELIRLNKKFDKLVPFEAVIQSYESDIDVAGKEYLEILQKFNQTTMESDFSINLRQVELAVPQRAEPSKKMLLVILSGIVSFVFCLVILFVVFFLDNTIKQPKELANKTQLPVIGHLNLINASTLDLKQLWSNSNESPQMLKFKDLLRSIRFEVDQELGNNKVLVINSLRQQEGKTLFALSLSYAYTMINKKVLLIDGNFINPGISKAINSKTYINDYLNGKIKNFGKDTESLISVLGNPGGDISLLEITSKDIIREKINKLKAEFDIIIIEASSLDTLNKSKEWILFADKVLTVFEANQNVTVAKKQYIDYLATIGDKFIGWVLNKVTIGTPLTTKTNWYTNILKKVNKSS